MLLDQKIGKFWIFVFLVGDVINLKGVGLGIFGPLHRDLGRSPVEKFIDSNVFECRL